MWWLFASACGFLPVEGSGAAVTWSGSVLDDPYLPDPAAPLRGATLRALDDAGDTLAESDVLDDASGSHRLTLPGGVPVWLHIDGPAHVPVAIAGTAPRTDALWFSGVLRGRRPDLLRAELDAFASLAGAAPLDGPAEGRSILRVEALDPAAFAGATLSVIDADGESPPVLRLRAGPDGAAVAATIDEPAALLLVGGLAPGPWVATLRSATGAAVEAAATGEGPTLFTLPSVSLP
jgi:hypothetical protein